MIRKKNPAENTLGLRFIAGSDEAVISGHANLHMSSPVLVDESANAWANREMAPDLAVQVELHRAAIRALHRQLHGILVPVVIRPHPEGQADGFELRDTVDPAGFSP